MMTPVNTKWLDIAIEYSLRMYWEECAYSGGLELHVLTASTENGGYRSRLIIRTESIEEAMRLSITILERGAQLDATTLTQDIYWQYGWQPELSPMRDAMVLANSTRKYRSPNYDGLARWRKRKQVAPPCPPALV